MRKPTVCDWLTMPKRGVLVSTTRRSISLAWPVISACSGAAKPRAEASAGTSWTRPSVIMMAPAMLSGGTSASVEVSAENSRVPSLAPSASPASATRTSRPGMRRRRASSAACAASVCWARSPNCWLGLLSMMTAATEGIGSRSSRVNEGLASASTMRPSATARITAPRLRAISSTMAISAAAPKAAQTTYSGTSGANDTPRFTSVLLLPQPLEQRRDVHLVGLVVAGQRVHHDVDAGAEGEFALARLARHQRQHCLAVRPHRPGAGEVVRGDQDRGHAVAGPRRALALPVALRWQRLDPQFAFGIAAGEIAQQIERLGQHVIA